MPIINAEGMFNGGRLRKCSLLARLYWPYLFLAANGYGRLEIDAVRLIARCFSTFDPRPEEDEILGYLQEYADNFLLFLYEVDGQVWGQWDTDRKFLPRWPTVADKESPEPPQEDLDKWKLSYTTQNKSLPKKLRVVSEIPRKPHGESSEKVRSHKEDVVGVGVGVEGGVGVGEKQPPLQFPKAKPSIDPPANFPEIFDERWDAHHKHSGRETKQLVMQSVLSKLTAGAFTLDQFQTKHQQCAVYWDREDWRFCTYTLLGWVENGMPNPDPKARDSPGHDPVLSNYPTWTKPINHPDFDDTQRD